MWNFSNGQCLTDLKSSETGKKVDTEITALVCVHDPELEDDEKIEEIAQVISVGWDRKIHIWQDEKEEEVFTNKILPQNNQAIGHKDDIMSAVFGGMSNNLVYTGAHDGTIIAWNLDNGAGKYQLSDYDLDLPCTSKNYIKESKSVDALLILDGRTDPSQKKLLSMTADQWLRFWTITEPIAPTFRFHCGHPPEDSLSAIAATKDNNIIVTGDTSGQLKVWDVSKVRFNDQSTDKFFTNQFFIIAHRSVINTINIVEDNNIQSGRFIITGSNDNNIKLHRLENGVCIGQFGQSKGWNIHDMSPYENVKPRYVRDWYLKLKSIMKANKVKKESEEAKKALEENVGSTNGSPVKAAGKEDEQPPTEVPDDFSDKSINYQDEYEK